MGKIWNDVNMLPTFKKYSHFESCGIWFLKTFKSIEQKLKISRVFYHI
jgi:hypothetical protein